MKQPVENVMDAIASWIEAAEEDGRPVPAPEGRPKAPFLIITWPSVNTSKRRDNYFFLTGFFFA